MEKDDLRGLPKEKKTCFVLCIECYWGVFISFLDVSLRLFPFVYPPQGSVPYWRDPAWPPEEEFRRRAGHETNEPNSPHPSLKRVRIGNQTAPPRNISSLRTPPEAWRTFFMQYFGNIYISSNSIRPEEHWRTFGLPYKETTPGL